MPSPCRWVLVGLLAACAASQAAAPAQSYVLKLKWSPGWTVQLKITTTLSGFTDKAKLPGLANGKLTLSAPFRAKATSVDDNVATVDTEFGPYTLPSGEVVMPKSASTQHINSLGIARESGLYFGPEYPKESVKAGATWKGADPFSGTAALPSKRQARYRLLSVRTVAGRRVADVSFETATLDGLGGKGKLSVDMATGRLINGVGSYEVADQELGANQTLQMDITVTKAQ